MTRAHALFACLILIAAPLAGCLSGDDLEELVDDIVGCMDENAANYDENATSELVGNCIYMATRDTFIDAMSDFRSIEEMLEDTPKAGYSQSISMSEWDEDMGMQMDIEMDEVVMADLDNDAVHVHNSISLVSMMTMSYTHTQIGEVVNIHYAVSGMMVGAEAESGSVQTRDASPNVLEVLAEQVGLFSGGGEDEGMFVETPDSDVDEIPEDAVITISMSDDMESQTMTMEYTEDGDEITMTIHINQNEDLMSFTMASDNGSATMNMEYQLMWGDAVVIEVDETLPRTSIPVFIEMEEEDEMFVCDNGEEIPIYLVDDGWPDCDDGSDESDEDGIIYLCGSGEEIPFSWVNDGGADCYDESDEPTYDVGDSSVFICDDGSEIPLSWVNDWEDDCDDGSDEDWYYDPAFGFECADGSYVIYFWDINNGWEDCDDASDEPNYDGNGAEISAFSCEDGAEIPLSWTHDNEPDCADDSDEDWYYDPWWGFECADGSYVIYFHDINNGYEDCDDASDEPEYDGNGAEISVFTCEDGSEVPLSWVQDWEADCADDSDEEWYYDPAFGFECADGSYVISFYSINDGYEDCDDGSDEPQQGEETSEFECMDGTVIPFSWVNDWEDDCPDGSDEEWYYHDDDGDDDGGDEGGPIEMPPAFIAQNQTLNAPISDFEAHFLSDCDEEYDDETGEMVEPDLDECTIEFSIPLTGGEANGVTHTYIDHDGDGLVSPGDQLSLEGYDGQTRIEIYDAWASEYSAESYAVPPALPGFGALMALTVLLGAAFATRRD